VWTNSFVLLRGLRGVGSEKAPFIDVRAIAIDYFARLDLDHRR
jgi:hypothetical protein